MSDHLENDHLLKRLRAEDPASDRADAEAPGEREAVRARATELLEADSRQTNRRILRPRLAIGAVLVVLAIGGGLSLILGGSSSGPDPALAIDKTQRWVTLTLEDPTASDAEMNQELADAGIDRVRVRSVPGEPKGVGTWAGYVELGPYCQGGVSRFGDFDIEIPPALPYNRANRHGAEGEFDLTLPRYSGALSASEVGSPYSKSTVRLQAEVDDPGNTAKVLVPLRPRSPDDAPDANDIGADQLVALGGVFAQYGEAVKDGQTSCADFGLKPLPKRYYTFPGY
jgi:hypothetical protein